MPTYERDTSWSVGSSGQSATLCGAPRRLQSEASPSGRDWTWEWRKQRPLRARTHLVPFDVAVTLLLLLMGLLVWNLMHCVWVASDVYSTPSGERNGRQESERGYAQTGNAG